MGRVDVIHRLSTSYTLCVSSRLIEKREQPTGFSGNSPSQRSCIELSKAEYQCGVQLYLYVLVYGVISMFCAHDKHVILLCIRRKMESLCVLFSLTSTPDQKALPVSSVKLMGMEPCDILSSARHVLHKYVAHSFSILL